jgi:hypothetical protein
MHYFKTAMVFSIIQAMLSFATITWHFKCLSLVRDYEFCHIIYYVPYYFMNVVDMFILFAPIVLPIIALILVSTAFLRDPESKRGQFILAVIMNSLILAMGSFLTVMVLSLRNQDDYYYGGGKGESYSSSSLPTNFNK